MVSSSKHSTLSRPSDDVTTCPMYDYRPIPGTRRDIKQELSLKDVIILNRNLMYLMEVKLLLASINSRLRVFTFLCVIDKR